tara:strand:+ start:240 stop:533 length:294 start_codon:yes stop_codon:yes gene_type:complete
MQPNTLYELVQLWREIHESDLKPTVFISQKLTQDQQDKIESFFSTVPQQPDQTKRILYSTSKCDTTQVFHYKTVPKENIADFQLKPPVKRAFQTFEW